MKRVVIRSCCDVQKDDYPDFLSGNERENTQHITVGYLTDEKKKNKKNDKTSKSKTDENQHTDKDTQNVSSSRVQSDRSSKSVRSLFRLLSSRSTQSKTNNINENPAESQDNSPSVQAATNALSVTARWGLSQRLSDTQSFTCTDNPALTSTQIVESNISQLSGNQVVEEEVAEKLTAENTSKNRIKKGKKNDRAVKLYESLDANVLRDVLVCEKDTSGNPAIESKRSVLNPLTAAASDQDLNHTVPDVPPLNLQSDLGSRMSTLKLVIFCLVSAFQYTHKYAMLPSVENVADYFQ